MPAIRKPMRYAHSEGITDVCYDSTGTYLLTCGSDGDFRIYKGFEDSDPESVRAGEQVTAIAVQNKKIVTASDNNCVQAFTFPEGCPDGMVTRFTASVNHLCFNKTGTQLAAGASDFNIKVVNIEDGSHKVLNGHEAPVLSIAFDPKDTFLVSSSCDGSVKIWTLDDQNCVKSLNLLPRVNDVSSSKTLCRVSWQPGNGKYIAIPVEKEIKVYERGTWNQAFSLNEMGNSELVSITSWSPCGKFLASASLDGEIIIWSIASRRAVERIKHERNQTICGLAWNPLGNKEIAYTDIEGQFGVCEKVFPDLDKGAADCFSENDMLVDKVIANSAIDDNSDAESLVGKKRQRVKNPWLDDEADEDDDDDDEYKDIRKLKAELAGPLEFGETDSLVEGDGASDLGKKISVKPQVIHTPVTPKLQSTFQPGSTPVHLMHRFMVWNSVGIVRCHNEDDVSSIEVEFHNTSTHHPIHLTNHMNHTMAALSSTAVAFACKSQEEVPSKLLCLHFGCWDSSKEWSVSMPTDEDIVVVSVSENWLAVATDKYLVRVFTIGGVQRHLISIPGPAVTMSMHGGQLLVAYHAANPLPGEQAIAIKLVDLNYSKQVVRAERLTLSRKSTLSWLGFSEEGTPVTVDSCGIVRLLNRSFGNTWAPIANTRTQLKSKSDHYWVVGLEEARQQLRCIICKGSTYPPTLPRPLLSLLPLEMPLCEMTTDKGQLEEEYTRSKLLNNYLTFRATHGFDIDSAAEEHAKTSRVQLMKLFALACKSDREFRAVELCELLPDLHSVSLAIKYAAKCRRINLAERLGKLAKIKAEEEEAAMQEEEDQEDYETEQSYSQTQALNGYGNRRSYQHHMPTSYDDDGDDYGEEEVSHEPADEYEEEEGSIETPSWKHNVKKNRGQYEEKREPDSLRSLPVLKKPKPSQATSSTHSVSSSQSSQGRPNPFRVTSPGKQAKGTCGKSFFDSVEADKKSALAAKNRISPECKQKSEPRKKRADKGKQMTLLSSTKRNSETTKDNAKSTDEKTIVKPTAKKVTGFKLWMEHNQTVFAEENPELPEGDLVKIALKKWRSLDDNEKGDWNEKAKKATESLESEDKKRKRENEENDENRTTKTQKPENTSKKLKSDSLSASAKLAGFAFSKN